MSVLGPSQILGAIFEVLARDAGRLLLSEFVSLHSSTCSDAMVYDG